MNKTERIACLYLTFLNYPKGLSFEKIKRLIPNAYQAANVESSRRKFERDKKELENMGIALIYYPKGSVLGGARIAEENIYRPSESLEKLPEINLEEDEFYILISILMQVLEDESTDNKKKDTLRSIMNKLLYKKPQYLLEEFKKENLDFYSHNENLRKPRRISPPHTQKRQEKEKINLEVIYRALSKSFVLSCEYKKEKRLLSGRGLICYKGRWCLIARCSTKKTLRVFYVDQMDELKVTDQSYEKDPTFRIKQHLVHPLTIEMHDAVEINLIIKQEYSEIFENFYEGAKRKIALSKNGNRFKMKTTNQEALFKWFFQYPDAIIQIGPEDVHKKLDRYLSTLKELYQKVKI